MLSRRDLLLGTPLLLTGCAEPSAKGPGASPFVRRDGDRLMLGRRRYRFAGANLWYAAYLGANAGYGDRPRLRRELDRLAALGVDNVRILGASELSPLKGSISPAFRSRGRDYDESLLAGLDFALAEMGRRGIRAVIYLTNFWEWSGGMMTYLFWTNGGRYIDMNDPAHPWPAFPDAVSQFYSSGEAVGLYHDYVRALVTRRNSVTGRLYAEDPAIMAWQLANEPRPGGSDPVGRRQLPAFLAWIDSTAGLIKSLDPHHLVSTGSEGTMGCLGSDDCVARTHESDAIDYVTAHVWPQNWGWVDPADLAGSWESGAAKARDYVAAQVATARRLGKPLVIEEFGFPRDGGSFDPASSTLFKDRFYALVYEAALASAKEGGPVAGTNFWAWGGEGRAAHPDRRFRPGDSAYLGDPPHEPQGWYSVFDTDFSTQALVRAHAAAVKALR